MCSNAILNLLKRDTDSSVLFLYINFSTFLEFGSPNKMSPKSAYQPQISSRSAPVRYTE